jgi:Fe-S oxidoreductase
MEINKNIDVLKSCRFCPMCRHVCPSGSISNVESDFPRGRAMILFGIHKGRAQYDEDRAEALYNCFLCGCCWAHCESHYDLPKLIKASRVDMVNLGAAPKEVYEIRDSMLEFKNPYSVKKEPYDTQGKIKKGARYLYYMGFEVNYLDHGIADAAVKVLDYIEADYSLIENEGDCGKVFSLLGFTDDAARAAKDLFMQIKEMQPSKIIVSDPLSYDCLKNDLKLLGYSLEPDIEVLHISQVITQNIDKLKINMQPGKVSLVDSEYLGRFNGIYEEPRALLKRAAGDGFIELMDNKEMQLASGEAAFFFRHKKFSAGPTLAKKICDMAEEKGTLKLVTLSPTTKRYINENTGCRAKDIAEFIAGLI